MHVIWQWIHPVRILTALYVFLAILAFTIHFLLLSTERYNWLQNHPTKKAEINLPAEPLKGLEAVRIG
jgi:light-harvesting complex 1 alpha chain